MEIPANSKPNIENEKKAFGVEVALSMEHRHPGPGSTTGFLTSSPDGNMESPWAPPSAVFVSIGEEVHWGEERVGEARSHGHLRHLTTNRLSSSLSFNN